MYVNGQDAAILRTVMVDYSEALKTDLLAL